MGKVGTSGTVPQMEAVSIAKQFPHFTQSFEKKYSFTAKTDGIILISFSSQFYGRTPNGLVVAIKKNGMAMAFNTNVGSTAPSTSAVFNKSTGDLITVDIEVRSPGTDVGVDYWVSAMANEPIEFSET